MKDRIHVRNQKVLVRHFQCDGIGQEIIKQVSDEKIYRNPIVTTLEPLKEYYTAEAYHQNYFKNYEKATEAQKASMNSRYCAAVIEPKVRKFREKYASKLRKGGV